MSITARNFLKKAMGAYLEEDGATLQGSFRDALTDLFHIAFNNKRLRKKAAYDKASNLDWESYLKNLSNEAYLIFIEEREQAENHLVEKTRQSDLPLLVSKDWEFNSTIQILDRRLRSEK